MYLDYYISIKNISNFYFIPNDISNFIYKLFINKSASIIQKKWFDYVIIHNTNLCNIINQLKVFNVSSNNITMVNNYYNLKDICVLYSFKICLKYFKLNISDRSWWLNKLHLLNQSLLYHCFNIDNELYFKYTYVLSCFYYKLKKHKNIL